MKRLRTLAATGAAVLTLALSACDTSAKQAGVAGDGPAQGGANIGPGATAVPAQGGRTVAPSDDDLSALGLTCVQRAPLLVEGGTAQICASGDGTTVLSAKFIVVQDEVVAWEVKVQVAETEAIDQPAAVAQAAPVINLLGGVDAAGVNAKLQAYAASGGSPSNAAEQRDIGAGYSLYATVTSGQVNAAGQPIAPESKAVTDLNRLFGPETLDVQQISNAMTQQGINCTANDPIDGSLKCEAGLSLTLNTEDGQLMSLKFYGPFDTPEAAANLPVAAQVLEAQLASGVLIFGPTATGLAAAITQPAGDGQILLGSAGSWLFTITQDTIETI